MKVLVPLLVLLLVGCRTAPPTVAVAPLVAAQPPAPPSAGDDATWEARLRQQRAVSEALLSQNEALRAQLAEVRTTHSVPRPEVRNAGPEPKGIEPAGSALEALEPGPDGAIDLIAVLVADVDDTTNPFVVRQAAEKAARETTLTAQGIIRGATTAALVNGQLLSEGETIAGFLLKRIEGGALVFERGKALVRVRVNGVPVRIRHT